MTRTDPVRHAPASSDASILASVVAGLHVPSRIVLPTSWIGHIPFASWLVATARPDTVVELGVHTGNSFFTFAESAARSGLATKLYGVDTWAGDEHAGAYAEDVFIDVSGVARARFPDSVVLLRKFFADAVHDFADGSVDLLHIDGLHTYEAVRDDFETWQAKLSRRAIVLFHDIAVTDDGFGVDRFWAEISARYPSVAFTHSNGLGVLFVGPDVPAAVLQLASSPVLGTAFVDLFAKLGDFLAQTVVRGPHVDALPINAQIDPPRVYFGTNGEFSEDNAIDARPLAGSPGALVAALAPIDDVATVSLRIDPMNGVGLRGVHRVLIGADGHGAPVAIVPDPADPRARLSIVPVDEGFIFVCTEGDSQWVPPLSAEARDVFRHGARIIFEPIAAPTAALTRILLRAVKSLVGPLDERLDEMRALDASLREDSAVRDTVDTLNTRLQERDAQLLLVEERLQATESERTLAEADRLEALRAAEAAQAEVVTLRDRSARLHEEVVALCAKDGRTTVAVEALRHGASMADEIDPSISSIRKALQDLQHGRDLARAQMLVTNTRPHDLATRLSKIRIGDRIALPLVPLSGVIPLDPAAQRWQAIDNDPQFDFNDLCRFAGHWVLLETDLDFDWQPNSHATIYLDVGSGYTEADVLMLPQSALASRLLPLIFFVPLGLRSARFDPCSLALPFGFRTITLSVLSKWQAVKRMAKVMRHTGRLRSLRDTYLPRWRTMRSPDGRRQFKHAFIESYRETLYRTAPSYRGWISRFEPSLKDYSTLSAERTLWPRQPVISVLMPTYDTPAKFLTDAIESVMAQQYPHWELCIADDASHSKHVRQILKDFAKHDRRIKVVFREENGHISAASNSALDLATGEFLALLDHDDTLHPLALHYVADAINRHPSAKLVFSDEDKLDASGARHTPYFKCDFNPDLFLAQNMITHLGCYRTETVRAVGGFRVGLEGSQDWDLALRVYEQTAADEIVHIPRVLYHWRELPGSTALSIDEKPYAQSAGRRAVTDHLARQGIDAVALPAPGLPMWNRIRYAVPTPPPKVSIVIPTRDKVEVLKTAVDSVLDLTTYPNFEIVIVDNGSVEEATATYLSTLPSDRVRVLRDDSPFNYSRINNRAVEHSSGEFVCLLNNDIEVLNGEWLDEMVSLGSRPHVGIVGARLWYPDHRIQHAGVILGVGGVAGHAHKLMPKGDVGYFGRAALQQQLSAVTGACMLISRAVWDEMGGLDEELSVAFNDIDLCMRVGAAGHRVVWTPFAEMIHYESLSRGAEDTVEKVARFNVEADRMRARWGDRLLHDPFYSPNLTLIAEDFSISWQPRPV